MEQQPFDLYYLFKETKDVLLNPKQFFASMKKDGGLLYPLLKWVLYSAFLIMGMWLITISSLLHPSDVPFSIIKAILPLIAVPIISLVALLILTMIVFVVSSLAGGNSNFEAALRATSSLGVVYLLWPIETLLHMLNFYLGILFWIGAIAYFFWLFYLALTKALTAKDKPVKVVTSIFAGLLIILIAGSFVAIKMLSNFSSVLKTAQSVQSAMSNKYPAAAVASVEKEIGSATEIGRETQTALQNNIVQNNIVSDFEHENPEYDSMKLMQLMGNLTPQEVEEFEKKIAAVQSLSMEALTNNDTAAIKKYGDEMKSLITEMERSKGIK